MFRTQFQRLRRQRDKKELPLCLWHFGIGKFPTTGFLNLLCKGTLGNFQFMPEFIVEELIHEYLSDNLVFVAVVAETVGLACGFEVVDKTYGFFFDVH